MGLDIVELVMEIEQHFGISIPDAEAERIYTVGELYVYILEQMGRNGPIRCPTSRAFYQLRRTMTQELGVHRGLVRPAALLRDLLPAETRTATWPRLSAALNLPNLPDPDPPPRGPKWRSFSITLVVVMGLAIMVGNLACILWLFDPARPPVGVVLFIFLLALVGGILDTCLIFGLLWIGNRYLNQVPKPKVRDLVLRLAAKQGDLYPKAVSGEPTPTKVWSDLARIISEWSGVPADRIKPEQRWIEELG